MNEKKWAFLREEAIVNCVGAAFQRGRVYHDKASSRVRKEVRQQLSALLREFGNRYKSEVSENDHCHNISELADRMSETCGNSLRGQRFRIGTAQKALNLWLKYLWCMGKISPPPHCTLDRRIIQMAAPVEPPKWTELDCIEEYMEIIEKCKRVADNQALVEWELGAWSGSLTAHAGA